MKIALIATHATPIPAHKGDPTDSESLYLCHLARNLAALGHRVTIHTRCTDPDQRTHPHGTQRRRGAHCRRTAAPCVNRSTSNTPGPSPTD